VVLFALNVLMAGWFWAEHRSIKGVAQFTYGDGVRRLAYVEPGRGCLLLGPSKDEIAVDRFVNDVIQKGVVAQKIERKHEVAPRYWVYVPSQGEYADSLVLQKELDAKGVDNFIIHRDGLYGALSVGVFENIDSAERMQLTMLNKGYQVSIRNIFNYESSWWVQLSAVADQKNTNEISRIAPKYGLPKQMREIFCKTVAS